MLRTRLLWFTLGFSVAGAASAQFVWRDLLNGRYALASDMKHKFDALEARLQNIENIGAPNSNLSQHKFDALEARVQNLENIGAPNLNSNPNLSQVED